MNDFLFFEIESATIAEAKEKIAELRKEFGEDIPITVRLGDGKRDKLMSTLDEGAKKLFKEVSEKLAKTKTEA